MVHMALQNLGYWITIARNLHLKYVNIFTHLLIYIITSKILDIVCFRFFASFHFIQINRFCLWFVFFIECYLSLIHVSFSCCKSLNTDFRLKIPLFISFWLLFCALNCFNSRDYLWIVWKVYVYAFLNCRKVPQCNICNANIKEKKPKRCRETVNQQQTIYFLFDSIEGNSFLSKQRRKESLMHVIEYCSFSEYTDAYVVRTL